MPCNFLDLDSLTLSDCEAPFQFKSFKRLLQSNGQIAVTQEGSTQNLRGKVVLATNFDQTPSVFPVFGPLAWMSGTAPAPEPQLWHHRPLAELGARPGRAFCVPFNYLGHGATLKRSVDKPI